jgi:hypothetical protein
MMRVHGWIAVAMLFLAGSAGGGSRHPDEPFSFSQHSLAAEPEPRLECSSGFVPLSGWWAGFCGDELRNFTTESDYGAMHSNAEALRYLDQGRGFPAGWIELEVYFATDRVPQNTGGLHILSACSGHKALGTPITEKNGYPGWLRPDFQIHGTNGRDAELKIGTYNADGDGAKWYQKTPGTGIPLAPQQWIKLRFEWRRSGDTITYAVNGRTHTVGIHPDSADIDALAFGNMDGLRSFGGTPEVRYRNLRWGRL